MAKSVLDPPLPEKIHLPEPPSMASEKPLLAPETKFFSTPSGYGNGCEEVSSENEENGMKRRRPCMAMHGHAKVRGMGVMGMENGCD